MSEPDESQAIDHVIGRLAERFPSLDRDYIAHVVEFEHRKLDDGRVRDFVPVLVEKAAKKRLKTEAKPTGIATDDLENVAAVPESDLAPDPMEVERTNREGHRGPLFGDLRGGATANDR